jgi:tRNA threonylcarbamoyladenosine biosynthesis protein TsaB
VLLLGLETSTSPASVALADERGVVAGAHLGRAGAHGRFVAAAMAFCWHHAGVDASDLTGVAVSLGPGRFTGMRVGVATAQALAHSRAVPVVGLASLDLIAFCVRYARRPICAVIDARRGELAWAFYQPGAGGSRRRSEFRLGPPERLAGEIEAEREEVLAVGDGAVAHRGLLAAAGGEVGDAAAEPSAAALVSLARERFQREETQRPEDLTPIYLRRPDARIAWGGRGALFGGTGQGGAPGVAANPTRKGPL